MKEKGFAPHLFLIGILLMGGIAYGAYYLGTINKSVPAQTPIPTPFENFSRVSPNPSISPQKVVLLSDAWNLGTKTYSNPGIDITFEYPAYFEVEVTDIQKANREWADQYKNTPNVRQPLYRSSFAARLSTPEVEIQNQGDDEDYSKRWREFCDNKMSVSVSKYENEKNASLFEFIADLKKTYPGDGITEIFDTYKQNLKTTNFPQEGSYAFEGIVGENPVKTVYFINKEKVYTFGLIGNCDTGGQYTPDADKVFENMLRSIKYL